MILIEAPISYLHCGLTTIPQSELLEFVVGVSQSSFKGGNFQFLFYELN